MIYTDGVGLESVLKTQTVFLLFEKQSCPILLDFVFFVPNFELMLKPACSYIKINLAHETQSTRIMIQDSFSHGAKSHVRVVE